MESLTPQQRAEIDALILAKEIITGMSRIMKVCGINLQDARDLFRARYQQLRAERGVDFACDDEKYWSCYSEDLFDMIANDW